MRIAGVAYEVVDTPDPRNGPKGKLPFISRPGTRWRIAGELNQNDPSIEPSAITATSASAALAMPATARSR
jgi:hypothetical protein